MNDDAQTHLAKEEIARIAATCVRCGLCLPHCPSYRVERNEADSPRGRLALMLALVQDSANARSTASLDRCLACGACEQVCPPKVSFVRALSMTRTHVAPANESSFGAVARLMSARPAFFAAGARIATHIRRWLPTPWRRRLNLDGVAGMRIAKLRPRNAANIPRTRQPLRLLGGCTANALEHNAIAAVERIALLIGQPLVVDTQHCCGALQMHLGRVSRSRAPQWDGGEECLVINSGCMTQWQRLLGDGRVTGIATWLDRTVALLANQLRHTSLRIALHTPCSQQMFVGEISAMTRMLQRIPGIVMLQMPLQPRCCGAAGTYFLNQPQASRQLADEMAAHLVEMQPDVVVSANGGCRAQLGQALFERGIATRVVHPAELIAELLEEQR